MSDEEINNISDIDKLISIISEQLHISEDELTRNSKLINLDIDSIDSVELCMLIEDEYNVIISNNLLNVFNNDINLTIDKLLKLINELKKINKK